MRISRLIAKLVFLLLPLQVYALDSVVNNPVTVIPQAGGGGAVCSYYFVDTYDGTVLPGGIGSDPLPMGTAINLKFYNKVYNSSLQTAVSMPTASTSSIPCAGTFQLVFTLELQANTNVSTVAVTPVVKDSLGTVLYPPATGNATTMLYPQCNNAGYASTPYCTVGWVTGSVQVSLPLNDQVLAPTLTTDSSVTVVGGQFEIFYLHP